MAAGVRRDRAGLAESIELRVLAAPEPADELGRLEEAAAIWRDLRSPLGEARVALLEALLSGDADSARDAEERLQELGARGYRAALSSLLPRDTGASPRGAGTWTLPRAARRRADPAHRVAVAEGARPPEDPRRAAGPARRRATS